MPDQEITHRDLSNSINYLTELMKSGFETINDRFDRLEARMDKHEKKSDLRFSKQTGKNRQFSNRAKRLEAFSGRVSRHTGIAF